MRFIWTTRGRSWGFRFLCRGGLVDPLPAYSAAFAPFEGVTELWHREGNVAALRFEDPLGRTDRAGRVIPHDFVLFDVPGDVDSLPTATDFVWSNVSDEYARSYELAEPFAREC